MSSHTQQPPLRSDGLQLAEERPFQQRFWRWQRVAWAAFAVFVLLALAGLTGGGGYFSRQVMELGGAKADLPRIVRWADDESARFVLAGGSAAEIVLGTGFGEFFAIRGIQPHPGQSRTMEDGLSLHFDASGEGLKAIDFAIMAKKPGWTSFNVSVNGETRRVSVLILP